jgi:IS4 transposase
MKRHVQRKNSVYIELIHLNYKEGKVVKILCLRLVHYKDARGRTYRFITNDWEITVEEAALIFKYRWTIELTFKKLKQNFQLRFFYLGTENGIKAQIWCSLITYLLINVIRVISESKKAFSTIETLILIHVISHLDLNWVVTEGKLAHVKRKKNGNRSPANLQFSLF